MGDGEDVEDPRQPCQGGSTSMTLIGVRTTQNACLGSDLSLGPLACRQSQACKSGGIGSWSDINWNGST